MRHLPFAILRAHLPALALVVFAACGGHSHPPAAKLAPEVAPAETGAPLAMGEDPCGGDAYGGDTYGADDPCAGGAIAMPEPPPPPADPPEVADYLPERTSPSMAQDAAAVYAVPVNDSPSVGPADAAVTLVTTYEFADPFSDRLAPDLTELTARYGKDLRIVWKQFVVHRTTAQASALAACAADKQGKFQPFMQAMLAAASGPNGNRRVDLEAVRAVAAAQQIDRARFEKDLHSAACKKAVIRDQQLFESLGQQAVPVSYVNGRVLQGAQPIDKLAALVDEELAKAQAAFKKGTKPAKYYAGLVKTGRTKP